MDEIDIAQIENDRHLERSLLSFGLAKDAEKNRLQSLAKHGIVNKCLYCDEVLDNYDSDLGTYESAYCLAEDDWSCRAEHEKELKALNSGRVRKVVD